MAQGKPAAAFEVGGGTKGNTWLQECRTWPRLVGTRSPNGARVPAFKPSAGGRALPRLFPAHPQASSGSLCPELRGRDRQRAPPTEGRQWKISLADTVRGGVRSGGGLQPAPGVVNHAPPPPKGPATG